MNRETLKTFLLIVLVGISFLLSYALWSYQPKYESLYNPDYVSETSVGGTELTVADLIEPDDIFFRTDDFVRGFKRPIDRRAFFRNLSTATLYDVHVVDLEPVDESKRVVELTFPNAIPAEIATSLFTFNEPIETLLWSFNHVMISLNEENHTLEVQIISIDRRTSIVGTIDKMETYNYLFDYFAENQLLHEYAPLETKNGVIYLPKDEVEVVGRTVVASIIRPELFFNALFPNPTIVTPNMKEAYFTDGTRGVRVFENGRTLEFVNPIQTSYERMDLIDLLNDSTNHINDHKGWTNDFIFEEVKPDLNAVIYRLHYEGYPVISSAQSTTIEQQRRDNELFQYTRPLIQMGNVLNTEYSTLPAGEDIIEYLQKSEEIQLEKIKNIKIAYSQTFINEAHSVVLTPNWYMLYDGVWKRINYVNEYERLNMKGGN